VFISAAARHATDNATRIYGAEGTIVLSNADEIPRIGRPGADFEAMETRDPNADLPGVNKGVWNVSVVALLREFAAAIAEGRQLREGATFADGWRNQLVLDAVRQSSRDRRWVDLA
jgi:predicted dehydrogenase